MLEIHNVLFVNVCNYSFFEKQTVPIGQLSLATLVNKKNDEYSAKVLDLNYVYSSGILKYNDDLEQMIKDTANYIIDNFCPDFVSLYTMCNNYHYAIFLAEKIKEISNKVIICLAGPQASIVSTETLKLYNFIDFISIGEGENTIYSILDGLKNSDFRNSYGIAYRKNNDVIIKKNDKLVENLDNLPFVNYEYLNYVPENDISIEVGRGCPFNCIFCTTNNFWKRKYRIKSPKRIFSEIEYIYTKFGIKKFVFEHDLFLVNKNTVIELCKLIIESGLKIKWGCSSRIDYIDEELILFMKKAGCFSIYFGIETGSQRIQKLINKNLNLDTIDSLIFLLDKYKISPVFSFIYGFPCEQLCDIEKTLELMYKIYDHYYKNYFNSDSKVQLHKLMFLPGTEITNSYKQELIKSKFARNDIYQEEGHWKNKKLNNIINNRDIFPQYFGLEKIEESPLAFLDIFYMFHLHYIIEYIDCTYKALLKHFKQHISIFLSYMDIINYKELIYIKNNNKRKVIDLVIENIEIFKKYIFNTDFNYDDKLIKDIFNFEYNVFVISHTNKDIKKEISFNYDVINIKKTRCVNANISKCKLYFIKDEFVKKIYKITG